MIWSSLQLSVNQVSLVFPGYVPLGSSTQIGNGSIVYMWNSIIRITLLEVTVMPPLAPGANTPAIENFIGNPKAVENEKEFSMKMKWMKTSLSVLRVNSKNICWFKKKERSGGLWARHEVIKHITIIRIFQQSLLKPKRKGHKISARCVCNLEINKQDRRIIQNFNFQVAPYNEA